MLTAFNKALKAMVADGSYEKILSKHGFFLPKGKSAGKTKLTIGTVDNGDMLIMRRLSKEYAKENPNVELDWRVLDEDTLRNRLMADMAISDGQFDIMTIGAFEAPIWAKRDWLIPFTTIPPSYDVNDVLKPMRDALSLSGKLYALPFYGESSMLFYRKDLFKKAGITIPDNPSYDDIMSFAAKIHDPKNGIFGIGLRGQAGWGANMAYVSTLINTFGGQWFDMNWNTMIDTPEWEKALTMYRDLITKYGPPNATQNNFNENKQLFSEGKLGMWIDATVAAGMLYDPKKSKVADKVAFAPAPIALTKKGSQWLWAWALAIPSSSKAAKEAANFILWATSKDYINLVAKNEGWLAVPPGTRVSTYQNANYQALAPFAGFVLKTIMEVNPIDKTLKAAPYSGIQFVGIPEFPSIGAKVGENVAQMVDGKLTVTEVLKKSQLLVSEQMIKSGYAKQQDTQ
jgi:sorbitol/mannitol transport system substrate-binding protein